jgi:hypothetical protein
LDEENEMKKTLYVFIILAVALPLLAEEKTYSASKVKDVMHGQIKAEGTTALILVSGLREGRKEEVLELLESQIDFAIVQVWNRAQDLKGDARQAELDWLRGIEEYRSKHPRKVEARIDFGKAEQIRQITAETREKAQEILEKLEPSNKTNP